ncbi:T3SS effector NleG family protein [Escherichia coli]|nr:T3SS effector NleG family protein [Escherichia coli]EIA9195584.1 T3SS effector NleG family protein [Escherichia coli]
MPFSFNLSSGNYLSTQDVEVLQRATRDHQMERLTIGERSFSVRYQSAMDAFIVDPVQGELIPQRGVFLRNAEGSRVCSLYDEMALSRIINDGMHHPLSREPITLSMLVAREQCEFDCSIGHFTVRSDCYSV